MYGTERDETVDPARGEAVRVADPLVVGSFLFLAALQSMLISASYDNSIKVWTEEDDDWYATETLTGHTATVWSIAFNADGSQLASCSDDKTIRIWERSSTAAQPSADANTTSSNTVAGSWKLRGAFAGQHARTIYTVDWSKDGLIASGAADDSVCIFGPTSAASSPATPAAAAPAAAPVSSPTAPSSTAALIASTTLPPQPAGMALLHAERKAHVGDVNCVAWNPTQPGMLATAGDDHAIKIWKYVP